MRNLYHIPVIQNHLDVGYSTTWHNPAGNVAAIRHEERVLSRASLDTLRAEGEPVAAVYAGFGHTTVVLDDGQELDYYWCDDGIAMIAACYRGCAAGLQPRTVQLVNGPADLRRLLHQPYAFQLGYVDHDWRCPEASAPPAHGREDEPWILTPGTFTPPSQWSLAGCGSTREALTSDLAEVAGYGYGWTVSKRFQAAGKIGSEHSDNFLRPRL